LIASATFFSKFESTLTEYQRIAMFVSLPQSRGGFCPARLPVDLPLATGQRSTPPAGETKTARNRIDARLDRFEVRPLTARGGGDQEAMLRIISSAKRISMSTRKKKVAKIVAIISTMTVVSPVSRRVGQTILAASARTCWMN
jgi:hypothetical protein